jgi:hypothetical protein
MISPQLSPERNAGMPRTAAKTVKEYLASLPAPNRAVLAKVRQVLRKHMPKGYQETMSLGMIVFQIPLARYPETYNGQPLWYAALAAQKNYNALHLMAVYGDGQKRSELEAAFKKAGKRLDMGKACIRFKTPGDLPLEAIGKLVGSVTPDAYIARYEESRRRS